MLTSETQRRIDACRDVVVGKLPLPAGQVELRRENVICEHRVSGKMFAPNADLGGDFEKAPGGFVDDVLLNTGGRAVAVVEANYIAVSQDAAWLTYSPAERAEVMLNKQIRLLRDYQLGSAHALQRAAARGDHRFLFEKATVTLQHLAVEEREMPMVYLRAHVRPGEFAGTAGGDADAVTTGGRKGVPQRLPGHAHRAARLVLHAIPDNKFRPGFTTKS